MAEDSGQEHDDEQSNQQSEHEVAQPGMGFEEEALPGSALANPGTLMGGDPRLKGRGNAPVRAAVMQRMQKTYGNRAVQRFLQRSASSTPIQRQDESAPEGEEELKKEPEEEAAAPPA